MGQGKGGAEIQSGTWASKVGVLSVLIKHPTWLRQPCQTTRLGPRSAVQKSHRCAAGSRAPSPTEDPGSGFGFAAFDERVGAAAGAVAQWGTQHEKGSALFEDGHEADGVELEKVLSWERMVEMCS